MDILDNTYIKDESYVSLRNDTKYEIIKYIVELCEKNDIQYFAFAQLLRGIIYYEDFVPDFDKETTRLAKQTIDIGFLRNDFNKFLSIVRMDSSKKFILDDLAKGTDIPRFMYRISTVSVLHQNDMDYEITFSVNLCPFDKVPENYDIREHFYRKIRKYNLDYKRIIRCKTFDRGNTTKRNYVLKQILYGWRNGQSTFKKLTKLIETYNNTDSHLYARLISKITKNISDEQLFPLQKRKFRDIYINIPNDYSNWTVDLNEEVSERIKAIQKVDLEILKEFDRVCRLLHVEYFLCGGSLLGYIRHNGFIPWDDDIDVGMLRKDYDRFINEAGPLFNPDFFLQTRKTDPNIPYLFSKVRKNNTLYVTKYSSQRDFHKGICLDVFPFDAVPNGEEKQLEFYKQAKALSVKHHRDAGRKIIEPEYDENVLTEEEKSIINYERKRRRKNWKKDLDVTYNKYINFVTQYNDKVEKLKLDTVASFVPSYTYIKYTDLLPIKDVEFEGLKVMCMQKPEVFLEMQYGDYMKLPPKHLQCGHPLVEWSVDTSKKGEE